MSTSQQVEYELSALTSPTNPAQELPETKNERLLAILAEVKGPEILHVGCVNHNLPRNPAEARHYLHYQLCRRFADCHVVGLDIQAAAVEQLGKLGFDMVHGDAHDLPYRQAFDTIVAGELLEHLQNPGLFLAGCARALKPGGRLVLSTPNVFTPMLGLMYLKNGNRAFNPDHAMWFCPQTVTELLRRAGFRVGKLYFVDDIQKEVVASYNYKTFVSLWKAARWLLPRRLRNTMVVVCQPS
jgi:2-polyprenyl-3-methyl-5-hydroxy-6-metoxy-1,4-benzoquinol methylase